MPKYSVHVSRDAYQLYECEIEADNPEQAADLAERAWKRNEPKVRWKKGDVIEFDEIAEIDPNSDDVTLIEEAA